MASTGAMPETHARRLSVDGDRKPSHRRRSSSAGDDFPRVLTLEFSVDIPRYESRVADGTEFKLYTVRNLILSRSM